MMRTNLIILSVLTVLVLPHATNAQLQPISTKELRIGYVSPTTNYISLQAPAVTTNYTLLLPPTTGTSGQTLITNGSGTLSWSTPLTAVSGTTNFLPKFSSASTLTDSRVDDDGTTIGIGRWATTELDVVIGNTQTNSSVLIRSGTGGIDIGATAIAAGSTIAIAGGANTYTLNLAVGNVDNSITQTISLGTGAGLGVKNVTVGSTASTSATTLLSGSGGINLNAGTSTGAVNIGTGTNSGTVTIGRTGGTLTTIGSLGHTGSLNLAGASSPLQANGSAGTSGQVLTSAGAGNTPTWSSITGLQLFEETLHTASPNNTVNALSWRPKSTTGTTNVDVVLSPKGAGALIAQVPDGTAAGGNKRGQNSVDWQTFRDNADDVASGNVAFIGSGQSNRASGTYSAVVNGWINKATSQFDAVLGGATNTASGGHSSVVGGDGNTASGYASFVGGGEINSTSGAMSAVLGGQQLSLSGDYSAGFKGGPLSMSVSAANTFVLGNVNLWLANNDNTARELRFYEPQNTSGAFPATNINYTAFKAGAQSADITYTLPTAAPTTNGQVLSSTTGGTMSWETAATLSSTGTTNRLSKFTSATGLGDSRISDDGTDITVGVGQTAGAINIGSALTTGTVSIGGTSQTGLVAVGNGTSATQQIIEIGRYGNKAIQIGSESNANNEIQIISRKSTTFYGQSIAFRANTSGTTTAPELRLHEDYPGLGITPEHIGLKAPAVLSASQVYTLPANAPTVNGQVLSSTTAGVMSWQTALTASTGWTLTGNAGTTNGGTLGSTPTGNFIGTTGTGVNARNLSFVTNNTIQVQIGDDGIMSTEKDIVVNGVRVGRGGDIANFEGYSTTTAVGNGAMTSYIAGDSTENNSAFGYVALAAVRLGHDNTAIGFAAMQTNITGDFNTAVGSQALGLSTAGNNNVAVGYRSLYNTNVATLGNATAVGYLAGRYVTGANGLTALGYEALSGTSVNYVTGIDNTAIGRSAGSGVTSGASNVFLGAAASIGTGTDNNSIVIGANTTGIGSNTVVLGNSSIVTTALRGNVLINNSGANNPGAVRFLEGSTGGSNYIGLRAPATLASDVTYTLPATDGSDGQSLTTDGSGVLRWSTPSVSIPINALIAATADNTINNANFEQEWQWNSLGQNRQGLTLSSNSTSVGGPSWRVLSVIANGSANTAATTAALEVQNSISDGGVSPANTGAYIWASSGSENRGILAQAASTISTVSNTGIEGRATSSNTVSTSYGVRGKVDVTAGTATTAYGGYFESAPSGTGVITTNIGGYFKATGGSSNFAIVVPAEGGNVGIGTTTPYDVLQVSGGNIVAARNFGISWPIDPAAPADSAWIRYYSDGGGENMRLQIGIQNDAEDDIEFFQRGQPRLIITEGRVGINKLDPIFDLDVLGTFRVDGTSRFDGLITTGNGQTLVVRNNNDATNTVVNVARLDVQSSGTPAVGIGTGLEFATETAANNTEVGAIIEAVTTDVTATTEDFDLVFKTMAGGAAAAERMRIESNGDVTATAFFETSDARLKEVIRRDGNVVYFKWKDRRDDRIHIGYLAQEVQETHPDQVNTDANGVMSVHYIELLIEKIRQLEKRIEDLESQKK